MLSATESTPKKRLPFFALLAANAISMVGNMLTMIAIPWFVLQTTGSATQTGITGFFSILPVVLAGLVGGALIDRLGYKRTSIIADLASGVTVALIPLMFFTVGLEFWQLMVLVFCSALLDAPGSTARAALIPELAAMADMPIERATSLNHIVERASRLIGAPLAGLLIAVMSTANVLWLDAISFLVSALIVVFIVRVPRIKPPATARGHYGEELRDGLRFLRRDRLLLALIFTIMLTNGLDAAYSGVIRPVYVDQVWGSAFDLGLLIAVNAAGAILGAAIYGAVGHRWPRHATFVSMFMLTGLRFWIMALYPSLAVVLIFTFISSLGAGPLNPIIDAVEYERIPPHMRGRVFGVITAGAWAAMPLGMLLGGVLTEQLGVQPMLILLGVTYLVVTLSMAFIPAMRQMDRRAEAASAEA
jgi:MFS family permease